MAKFLNTTGISYHLEELIKNNDEMGVYVTKSETPDLYNDIYQEVSRLLTISDEIRVSVQKFEKTSDTDLEKIQCEISNSKSKLVYTKIIAEEIGVETKKVNKWFSDNGLMTKEGNDWLITPKGIKLGEVERTGKFGKFVVWPNLLSSHIQLLIH